MLPQMVFTLSTLVTVLSLVPACLANTDSQTIDSVNRSSVLESTATTDRPYIKTIVYTHDDSESAKVAVEEGFDDFVTFLKSFVSEDGLDFERFESMKSVLRRECIRMYMWANRVLSSNKKKRQSEFARIMYESFHFAVDMIKSHQSSILAHHLIRGVFHNNMRLLMLFNSSGDPDTSIPQFRIHLQKVNSSLEFNHEIYSNLPKTPANCLPLFECQYEIAKTRIMILDIRPIPFDNNW